MSVPAVPKRRHTPREWLKRLLLTVPIPQTPARRAAESAAYWATSDTDLWLSDSHVRGSVDGWDLIGQVHHGYFLDFTRAVEADPRPARVLEWGAGGGANAVVFAPDAEEFIAVDVSQVVLEECRSQVAAVCETTFTPVLVPVDRPEAASELIAGEVDLFLCFYVIELLPSRKHARRVMEEAARLLRPGGLAVVQVKYQTRSPLTRSRTWAYRRGVASMTAFPIEVFWSLAAESGFTPHSVRLIPRNHLDERYAYYFLVRS
jgi:SAM-dependent methyltransferase